MHKHSQSIRTRNRKVPREIVSCRVIDDRSPIGIEQLSNDN